MKNSKYVVLICKAPSSSPVIYSLLESEPSDEHLKEIWANQNLQTYKSEKYGQYSDLIEVYEFEQLEDAFLEVPATLKLGDVLKRNPRSSQDAINAYFP